MLCYVSLPNGQCLEVQIDPKQTGKVVLEKVLEKLGIVEVDLFGLQYKGTKNEELWLNLRNRVCDHEIQSNHGHCFYRLRLLVKFFVQPHLVQQESTKELFYTQTKDVMRRGLISLAKPHCDESKLAKIVASIAQAEYGDRLLYQNLPYTEMLQEFCSVVEPHSTLINQICMEHSKLHGVPRVSARNFLLKEVCSLPGYGVEEHKTVNAQGADISFRVGPEGVVLSDMKTKAEKAIPYSQIRLATHDDKLVHIELLNDAGESLSQECFKLVSRKAAVALYRCITEMHSFYRCDTICSNVHSQYSRDFKGTLVSIFNENSDCGKRYIFDIQRTCREAYDHVRRKLFAKSSSPVGSPIHSWCYSQQPDESDENGNIETNEEESTEEKCLSERTTNLQREVKILKQRLESVEESLLCCICMYKTVCTVLCPCGHMTCDVCSDRIDTCPQCRTVIDHFQRVFHGFGLDSKRLSKKEQLL